MKRTHLALALTAALFCAPVLAAEHEGWVYNGLTGYSSFDGDVLKDEAWMSNPTFGYRWGTWGVDVGYAWFGNFEDKDQGVKIDFDLGGFTGGVNFNAELSDKWAFQARGGVFSWDGSAHTNIAGVRVKESDNGTDYYLGASLLYNLGPRYSLGVGYHFYKISGDADANIHSWGVASEFRF